MGTFQSWGDALSSSWINVVDRIIQFLPNFLGAILVIIFGWLVAIVLEKLFDQVARIIGLQTLSERIRLEDSLKKSGIKMDLAKLIGAFVKWVVMIVSFLAAAEILTLNTVADFLNRILAYAPNVAAAAAILLIGVILANFLAQVIMSLVKGTGLGYADILGTITRWSIVIFAFLAALMQLGIAQAMIQTLFTGVIAFLAIAGGLAFGLGGKDAAADLINKVKKDIENK